MAWSLWLGVIVVVCTLLLVLLCCGLVGGCSARLLRLLLCAR